jgi:hypothetical protein
VSHIVLRHGGSPSRSPAYRSLPSPRDAIFAPGAFKLLENLWYSCITFSANSSVNPTFSSAVAASRGDGGNTAMLDGHPTHLEVL